VILVVLVLGICILPFPQRFSIKNQTAAQYDTEGNRVADMTVSITGFYWNYLLREDRFDLRVETDSPEWPYAKIVGQGYSWPTDDNIWFYGVQVYKQGADGPVTDIGRAIFLRDEQVFAVKENGRLVFIALKEEKADLNAIYGKLADFLK